MALLVPNGLFRITDASGNPVSGGKAYFYATGTTTLQTVYADSARTTPLTNPVVADGGGLLVPIYLGTKTYRLIVKTAADATIQDIDPFTPGASGLADLTFLQAGTGAVSRTAQTKQREAAYSVTDFGALGDDATNNATTLLAAITAASVAGVGMLMLPDGTFRCSTSLTLPDRLTLCGNGKRRSFIKFTGATNGIVVSDAFASVGLRDLTLTTNNVGALSAIKFSNKASGASNCVIENVDIEVEDDVTGRWDYGIWAINWQNSRVSGMRIPYGCDVGIHLEFGCNATTWTGIEIVGYGGTVRGIEMFGYDTALAASYGAATAEQQNTFDNYWYGVTVQGSLSGSAFYVEGCSPKVFGMHPENTDTTPSDGADIAFVGPGINNASLAGIQGGSLLTTGTIRNLTVTQGELNGITIGSGTQGGQYGTRFTSLTDSSGGTWDVVTGGLGNGNPYPSIMNNLVVANTIVEVAVTSGTVTLPATPTARIILNTASATNITALAGGIDRQRLLIGVGDTNATLKTTGNLKIGTDFVASNTNARIELERQGANWMQISRFVG